MSLHNLIKVNTHYTRSVNLERDASSVDVTNAYIPTSRALRTFARIAEAFNTDTTPRAWSLIGPYGSGKSSFSVFLAQLLSHPSDDGTHAAIHVLRKTDKGLTSKFSKEVQNSDGYLKVLITGAPESMSKRIVKGLAVAAEMYWASLSGAKPKIIEELKKAVKRDVTTSETIELIQSLQDQLVNKRCRGILLVIDELGKFLEYEARHYGANDIYLLQALAEHACKGSEKNLFLFVMLHQSFEQYAKGLGENLKNEWSKVQGRFEEVPFLESAEQVLRVVSAAFKQSLDTKQSEVLHKRIGKIVQVLQTSEAISSAMTLEEATDLYSRCYPLHPVSAVILPLLCQKVAQNERTLFSYLGSQEEYGLQHMISELTDLNDYVYPHHIYDYFISNQPSVLGDYLIQRRWTEVVIAIDKLGDASEEQINLLKTIGILNIIGAKGGIKASNEILESCAPTKESLKKSLKELQSKSCINYRRFNSEYRVWQGSDFDLEEALQDELNNIGQFALANELNSGRNMLPIVARKYTIQTGALRYYVPTFVDAKSYITMPPMSDEARIIFYLASDQDDEKIFQTDVINYFSNLDIVALCLNGAQLREAVAETLALNRVRATRQELNNDPVAKREFEDRLTAAEQSEATLLQNLIDSPENSKWFHAGHEIIISNRRVMQQALSNVLDKVYCYAPRIFNELINRDRPSSQAIAACNKLLSAMFNKAEHPDLAIDKFPPEKAIYRAVLREAGLHRLSEDGETWQICEPPLDGRKDKANIRHVWKRIDEFLDATESEAKSLADLNAELMAPPYGVKAGLLPILYIAAYIVYQHELAIYENRIYCPYFTQEMLDRFMKRPDEFTVQRFRISGMRASLFKEYSKALHGDDHDRTLLELAKALATEMGKLPEYTQKSEQGISKVAKDVRAAFNLAKSPEYLLFRDLPKALGYENEELSTDEKRLAQFAEDFTSALRELRGAYAALLGKQRQLLAQAFNLRPQLPLPELRKVVAGYCYGLEHYTVDTQGLRAFIMRLNKVTSTDEEWFENILIFLGHKPSKKWLDTDQSVAEHRLVIFSRGIIDLDKLRIHERDRASKMVGDFDVYLLRSIKKGEEMRDEVVTIDQNCRRIISNTREKLVKELQSLPDKELRLALLAEIVDEFLSEYQKRSSSDEAAEHKRGRKPRLQEKG